MPLSTWRIEHSNLKHSLIDRVSRLANRQKGSFSSGGQIWWFWRAKRLMIKVKRIYDPPEPSDGARYLVDRLWPRGVKKKAVKVDGWLKDVAPGDTLRRWFGHEKARWAEFQSRYFAELDAKPSAWQPLLEAARRGNVTLLFSAQDMEHNNAVALRAYLTTKLR